MGLRAAILSGRLAPGRALPSSRALAGQLGLGRNMVVEAYEQLAADGLTEARPGAGTFVAASLPPPPHEAPAQPPQPDLWDRRQEAFALGQTEATPDLLARLGAATRRAIAQAGPDLLSYGDPRGSPALRREIAAFLAAHRGLACDPDCIVVVSGTQHGLRLCLDALLPDGAPVWMEDPGYTTSRDTLIAAGMSPVPVPVDAAGIDVAAGRALSPQAVAAYVTPSHQFPLGRTLEMTRRVQLIDWARSTGAWILEDDYDSEFRYAGPPLSALAGLAPDHVIYIGTFAKMVFPGLRIGYLVLPPRALRPVLAARAALDRFSAPFLQEALAELMREGHLARHLRRVGRSYRTARDLLAAELRESSGGALVPEVPDQGLHMVVRAGPGLSPRALAKLRRSDGPVLRLLSDCRFGPPGEEALILGFSGHDLTAIRRGARSLGKAARRLLDGPTGV
ncbi:aminotransferase class I/II-fold pyridoxal phosphate-dependent enzyme [Pseudooceanicola sp. GBMRC 2024]|uniref:Aminotransferase class I/II-fold pyridoxal phosphate-dependent enzyme n=2 Tax=Paracoccaceae TaxID=31989 RepID=A0A6L7FX39_9RHOB|nr:aminotransferase class I/II-fold pyridoxal phosphate-dependent enzyme [Pseudooceanicola albus]